MPIVHLPFTTLYPDAGELNNNHLVDTESLIPYGGRYIPVNTITEIDEIEQGFPAAIPISEIKTFKDRFVYVGRDDGSIIENEATAWPFTWTPTLVLAAGTTPSPWHFVAFGDLIIATNGVDDVASQAIRGAAFLQPAITIKEVPKAKFITTIGERILLGNITNVTASVTAEAGPHTVWWSGTNNIALFENPIGSPAARTDFQTIFDDYGEVTGLSGGRDFAFIFKERAIYRLASGGAFGFTVTPVSLGVGTEFPRSIVQLGDATFFWGPDGPSVVDFNGVRSLARDKISRQLLDDDFLVIDRSINAVAPDGVRVALDPITGVITWLYRGGSQFITYNYHTNDFAYYNTLFDATTDVGALDSFATLNGSRWRPLGNVVYAARTVGVGSTTESLYFHDLTTQANSGDLVGPPALETGFFQLGQEGRTVKIDGVRPVVSLAASATTIPTITIRIKSREKSFETSTETTVTNDSVSDGVDVSGWIPLEDTPYNTYHSFRMTVDPIVSTAFMSEIEGIDVDFTIGALH